jgi:Fic family protein
VEYRELAELYHRDNSNSRAIHIEEEEHRRRTADATFLTGIETDNGELFIAMPRELSLLSEDVLRAEQRVSSLLRSMPPVASDAVLRGSALDEVVSTNAIEDIHSTRRQIKDALGSLRGNSLETRRFRELATLYLSILSDEAVVPKTPEDIRSIYDKVMDGEVSASIEPDGKIFRKSGVDITTVGVRVIHKGLEPESKIIEAMALMLKTIDSDTIPAIYAAAASHYLFEYAHPFYDGNGRTGRYLLSLFLSASLSLPTVLSLSRTICENRDDYYRAFRTVENPLNHGELTFFVYTVLELIRKAQVSMIDRLERSEGIQEGLIAIKSKIEEEKKLRPQELETVWMLMQYEAFGLFGDASVSDVADHLDVGEQMARRYLKTLETHDIVEKRHRRSPLTFALTSSFKDDYGIEESDRHFSTI